MRRALRASRRVPENRTAFTCVHCGWKVGPQTYGTAHRNHCPNCLWSLHLDNRPGDRRADCGGRMEPVAVWVRHGGEWAVIHRCQECGAFSSNRIAGDDNELVLISLAVRPLAQPPFPLDRLEAIQQSLPADGRESTSQRAQENTLQGEAPGRKRDAKA